MGEIKSVKVDNWGVFFLQKLQNFFNKTDYCDLTLQFRDNSQLKVHRLVLSACTDFFNVLEQTCEMVDDALIMPNELQADVVVPIVNFMYTGTLEFELKMYGKLLRTAKEMNMTVLLKLLEAHRRTMEGVNRANRPPSPKSVRRRPTLGTAMTSSPQHQVSQQRRVLTPPNTVTQPQRRIIQTKCITTNTGPSTSTTVSPQQLQYRQQIGTTSFVKTGIGSNSGVAGSSQVRAQYGNITVYETQQTAIKQEPEEQITTSPFEQLRKGYNNNKRPATSTFISPPSKKLNIEDVKEFAEQQRMRKQIAAEYGEDHGEYDNSIMDDDIHNDDDDDDATMAPVPTASTSTNASTSRQTQLQHGATTITINQNEKPPTIVVKDSSNSKMNHAKIIKEVLRQYPHLVKSNKNIKLKIMPNVGDQPQKIIVKKEQCENVLSDVTGGSGIQQQSVPSRTQPSQQTLLKPTGKLSANNQPQPQSQPQTQQAMPSKSPVQPKTVVNVSSQATSTTAPTQKRRIDSKTMHSLIALGADNTTGPWLCLRCGVNGRPISIPSYRGFRRHLINTHKETIDPALCEHCGWRSSNNRELHYHMEVEHKVKTTSYTFPECLLCNQIFLNTNTLNQHMVEAHPDENKQQCIYCNKIFAREIQLYTHMKTYHKKQALEDGIIDYSDEEFPGSQDEIEMEHEPATQKEVAKEKKDTKIKIISDICLPSAGTILEAANLTNVASAIATNLGIQNAQEYIEMPEAAVVAGETKFVSVDGNEMVLTDEQRKEIMSQLNQEHGGVVMLLNEPPEFAAEAVTEHTTIAAPGGKETETTGADTMEEGTVAEEDFDDSQIYNELNTQNNNNNNNSANEEDRITAPSESTEVESAVEKKNTSNTLDESKESVENLEWAENLISAHELADEALEACKDPQQEEKKDDVINQKLKELTGDWSEDENEGEAEPLAVESEKLSSTDNTEKDKPADVVEKEDIKNNEKVVENKEELDKEHEQEDSVDMKEDELEDKQVTDLPEADDKTTNADDSKNYDDDVDMLMKSLHKDDTSDAIKSDEKVVDEEKNIESENIPEEIAVKDESLKSLETQKESSPALIAPEEIKTEQSPKAKNKDEIPDVNDNAERNELLAELISKTDCMEDDQEFISEKVESDPLKPSNEECKTTTLDDVKAAVTSDEPLEKEVAIEAKSSGTSTDDAKCKSETVDRVKSLISEWGDDEDEADVEEL